MNLLLLAIAPVVVIVIYIYFKDKFEKEPWKLLAKVFLLGATLSILITFILSFTVGDYVEELTNNKILNTFIQAFIGVALIEEFSKYIIVRKFAQKREEFNEPFDGIVYAVMVSMGFAALENILYVFSYGYETGFVRAFTAVPAHATFGVLMGYYMGKAKFSKSPWKLNMMGLLAATIFHGAYDFFLFLNWIPGIATGAFVSLVLGLYLARKAMKSLQARSFFRK